MGPQHHVTASPRPAIPALVAVTAIAVLSACSGAAASPSPSTAQGVASAPAPADTPTPSSTPAPTPSPTSAPPMPTAIAGAPASDVVLTLTASGHAWDVKELSGPAGKTFKIEVTNKDADPHNLVIASGTDVASRLATLAKFGGPASQSLDVPGLPAGTYLFRCTLHDSMRGQLTIK
jgi:plastocyanin